MGLHNPPTPTAPEQDLAPAPPDFQVHPVDVGVDTLPDYNYFLPLADNDVDDGGNEDSMIGTADDVAGVKAGPAGLPPANNNLNNTVKTGKTR